MSSGNDGISWHVLLPSFCSGAILLTGLLGVGFRRSVSIWLPGKEVLKKRGGEPGMRGVVTMDWRHCTTYQWEAPFK